MTVAVFFLQVYIYIVQNRGSYNTKTQRKKNENVYSVEKKPPRRLYSSLNINNCVVPKTLHEYSFLRVCFGPVDFFSRFNQLFIQMTIKLFANPVCNCYNFFEMNLQDLFLVKRFFSIFKRMPTRANISVNNYVDNGFGVQAHQPWLMTYSEGGWARLAGAPRYCSLEGPGPNDGGPFCKSPHGLLLYFL